MSEGHGAKTHRVELAISALLTESSVSAAAAKAGVSHTTLKTWMKKEKFRVMLARARREILSATVARILAGSGAAVNRLMANLDSEEGGVSNTAAKALLDFSVRGLEFCDLDSWLREAEKNYHAFLDRKAEIDQRLSRLAHVEQELQRYRDREDAEQAKAAARATEERQHQQQDEEAQHRAQLEVVWEEQAQRRAVYDRMATEQDERLNAARRRYETDPDVQR
jgi:hypothetical protein